MEASDWILIRGMIQCCGKGEERRKESETRSAQGVLGRGQVTSENIGDRLARASKGLPESLDIFTRRGNKIENTVRINCESKNRELMQKNELEKIKKEIPSQLEKEIVQASAFDSTYNCVGYVFSSGRVWIHPDQVYKVLSDDEYITVDYNDVKPGDLAIYEDSRTFSVQHIGLVVIAEKDDYFLKIRILSKWGNLGLFIHPPQVFTSLHGDKIHYRRICREI